MQIAFDSFPDSWFDRGDATLEGRTKYDPNPNIAVLCPQRVCRGSRRGFPLAFYSERRFLGLPLNPPAFQFYVDDFLGGTMHLTDAEVGLYIRLLCVQWSVGKIPCDNHELSSYGKGETKVDRVKAKFEAGEDGFLRNKRMELEREKQEKYRKSRSDNGKLGGRPMKPHGLHTVLKTKAQESSPSPSPSPISTGVNGEQTESNLYEITQSLKAILNGLYGRKENHRWTHSEETLLCEVARNPDCKEECAVLKAYRDRLSDNEIKYFPHSAGRLLENWGATLDKARGFKEPKLW